MLGRCKLCSIHLIDLLDYIRASVSIISSVTALSNSVLDISYHCTLVFRLFENLHRRFIFVGKKMLKVFEIGEETS